MRNPPAPTERQAAILAAIRNSATGSGRLPTIQEIAEAVGLASTSSVAYHLRRLEEQGVVSRMDGASRIYRIC
ncbi:MarR family transcriptional regulator [Streptomyces sp. NPDC051993]|uniref:LexA family protein n=1 Tax=Streptomyces sp. NPDC051993 TaxID=3155286 RepID=UPI003446CB34